MPKHSDRQDDERLLAMIRLRVKCDSSEHVGQRFGLTSAAVRIATNRVRNADLQESGEAERDVAAAYGLGA